MRIEFVLATCAVILLGSCGTQNNGAQEKAGGVRAWSCGDDPPREVIGAALAVRSRGTHYATADNFKLWCAYHPSKKEDKNYPRANGATDYWFAFVTFRLPNDQQGPGEYCMVITVRRDEAGWENPGEMQAMMPVKSPPGPCPCDGMKASAKANGLADGP